MLLRWVVSSKITDFSLLCLVKYAESHILPNKIQSNMSNIKHNVINFDNGKKTCIIRQIKLVNINDVLLDPKLKWEGTYIKESTIATEMKSIKWKAKWNAEQQTFVIQSTTCYDISSIISIRHHIHIKRNKSYPKYIILRSE